MESKRHFVLVHGVGHGAWCWYKVAILLKSAGHKVTTLDLGASGINLRQVDENKSVFEYAHPLLQFMDSLPSEEKVILVGHSFGGIAASLAMEKFSNKILLAVFVTAVMPNTTSPPGTIIQELFRTTPLESLLDCEFSFTGGPDNPPTSLVFGTDYMETKMYKNCQPEDIMLAQFLVRPASLFIQDLMSNTLLTNDKYGSVRRMYIICTDDDVMNEEFQLWMIKNIPVEKVKIIKGADHMVMLSRPQELCLYLLEST